VAQPGVQRPPAKVPSPAPPDVPQTDEARVARLKALVEEAGKAVESEDFPTASDRLDAVDVLTSDWSTTLLQKPEVQVLLQRVQDLSTQIPAPAGLEPEPGIKAQEEVVSLTGEDLRAELERVRLAERDTSYDFPIDLNDKVLTWVNLFTTTKKGFMENALGRASMYLPMIRQVFAEEGIPQDLAYLAVIESGFRNEAKSRARAVGMWQFIRSTGKLYGLSYNRWIEERRDPVKATRAAARYLKRLYEETGDWYLAVSSYNAGPLSLERAAQNLGTRNFWDMARSRWLRNETKNYVPELCAAILVGRHPDRYGIQLDALPPFAYETVSVPASMGLAALARLAETDVATLKHLNPELLRPSTPPGTYSLRVPPGKALICARGLAKGLGGKVERERLYLVRRGDTLAKVAHRLGVDPEDLLAENSITARQFRPGRRLRVPLGGTGGLDARTRREVAGERALEALPYLPSADVATLPGPVSRPVDRGDGPAPLPAGPTPQATPPALTEQPPVPPVPAPPAAALAPAPMPPASAPEVPTVPAAEPREIRARRGDTLARIARSHGVPLGELIRLNPEAARRLHPGDTVRLPGAAEEPGTRVPERQVARPAFHVVKRGETLAAIAREHHLEIRELRLWNGLKGDRIRVGQRLRLAPR
jgi:membrane-bound lytic murein transglycosylase D